MRIIKGVDIGEAALLGQRHCVGIGFVIAAAENHDFGAMAAGLFDLHHRRGAGHHDGRRDAQVPGVIGKPLSVIAGRGGDNPGLAFALVHQQQRIERAAFLVGSCKLQILEFEKYFCAAKLGKGDAFQRRRIDDPALDPVVRCFHILEVEGGKGGWLHIIHIA